MLTFLCFLVVGLLASLFLGFLISKFQSSKVSNFKDSKIFLLFGRDCSHITNSYISVLEDIDPIFKMFKKFSTNLQDLSAPVFPPTFNMFDFRNCEIAKHNIFGNMFGMFS